MEISCFKEEDAWNVEEDESLKLIKCLRGRLFAERQTTRAAKEEAQLNRQKLLDLEKKLKQEMKLRDRAENRLKLLKQKLTLLKMENKPAGETPDEASL